MGENISGWETVFYDGMKTSDLGSSVHVLKHLHRRIIFGHVGFSLHEGTLWIWHRAVIYFILTKKYSYISETEKKFPDDDGTGVKPKKILQRRMGYTSGCDSIQKMWYRDRKVARDHLCRKRKPTEFIYLPGSKFREADGHLNMSSCLQDSGINSYPRIGK